MSDLSDLRGIFADLLRWNAETGVLGIASFNPETGEREVQEILLGNTATFVLDLATRERGYGLIKIGQYDMQLKPVGSPPPPWPGDEDYKPAIGCWVWNPNLGELDLRPTRRSFGRPSPMSGTRPGLPRRPSMACNPWSGSSIASRSRSSRSARHSSGR